nr:reverse transcriptase domain-containing protein [Tanacetum cinerariifolium]
NIPPNDPNVDAHAIVPAPVNPDHAPAQPVGLRNGFAPYWIRNNIPNNQNGWIEEDAEEEEEDPKEDPEEDPKEEPKDDDDDMEMDDEAEVIDPYIDDGSNNPPPSNFKDEETPPTSLVIPDADGQPIPPIASFGQNFHFGKSSSTANFLTRNSKIVLIGPMCPNLGTVWKRLGKMEKFMSERIDTEGRINKKFKEQDRHFLGLGCDNIEMDRIVRNVMSDLSRLKKLIKGLSDRFDEYERSKVFDAKRVLEKELVNERNAKEFYREFVREPPAEPSAQPVPAPYPDDPYVVTRDAAIVDAAIATSGIDDDDDDTATMDSQPHEPHGSPRDTRTMPPRKSTRGNPHPLLTQDTVNHMIQESVEAAIRAERERVQNEANRTEGPNVARVARECTFADFMKCSPITFRGNEGAVDRALTWWNSLVATSRIEVVTRKTWAEMKVTMMEEFCPPEEIQRMEGVECNIMGTVQLSVINVGRLGTKLEIVSRKWNNPRRGGARGQAYALSDHDQNLRPNVVMGTFLLNNCYARVLFYSGSDKSFMNINFSRLIDIEPVKVNHSSEVELADGRVVSTNTILRGCVLNLVNHLFEIDLMPIELGTFDVITGMDWLILHDAIIVCRKKEVHVPFKKRTLVVKDKNINPFLFRLQNKCLASIRLYEPSSDWDTTWNSLNDSPSISETSSQSPPLDDIFCKRCTCKSCGKDAHIGYNCPSKVPVISNPEPCNNQTIDELPQALPSFHSTFHSDAESPFTLDSTPTYVDESSNVFNPPPQPLVVAIKTLISRKIFKLFHNNILVVMIAGLLMTRTNQYTVDHPIFNAHNSYLDSQIQLNNTLAKIKDQMTSITSLCELACQVAQKKREEKEIEEERAAKAKYWKLSVCYDDDDDEERSDSLDDNIISGLPSFFAITPDELSGVETLIPIPSESDGIPEHVCDVPSHDNSPPLDVSKDQIEDFSRSNEDFSSIDDDSFSIDDIDYVEASPPDSELVNSDLMEIVIPEVGGIDDDILLTIKDDVLREKLLNVNLLISKIEALNANPTPSSDCKTKSSSTFLISLLEETNTFDNSSPEFETFCFDVKEIISGSTTISPDISLPEYEAFYDDHVKEISSGSPTTHSDSSLYASFMFDLSINPFPPADRSDSYEFIDELIPFISAPEYDCFRFMVEPNSRDSTKDVVENISPTKEPQVLNTLSTHPTLQLNTKFQPSSESLFAYVVWIFLPFLVYSVVPYYILSLWTEDIIFDPGICKSTFSRPDISHRCGTVKKFNTHRSHLNKCPMMIHGQNNPPLDVLLFHFYPP